MVPTINMRKISSTLASLQQSGLAAEAVEKPEARKYSGEHSDAPNDHRTPYTNPVTANGADQYVAALIGSAQARITLGTATGTLNVALVQSVVAQQSARQQLTTPLVTSIESFLKTPACATLISDAIVIATRTFAYLKNTPNNTLGKLSSQLTGAQGVAAATGAYQVVTATMPQPSPAWDSLLVAVGAVVIPASSSTLRGNPLATIVEQVIATLIANSIQKAVDAYSGDPVGLGLFFISPLLAPGPSVTPTQPPPIDLPITPEPGPATTVAHEDPNPPAGGGGTGSTGFVDSDGNSGGGVDSGDDGGGGSSPTLNRNDSNARYQEK
jgi:hypothetical protein